MDGQNGDGTEKEYNKISDEVTGLYREFEKSKKA